MKEMSEWELLMYKFSVECACKGIDIEYTIGTIANATKEIFAEVLNLATKNYEFLLKCRDNKQNKLKE